MQHVSRAPSSGRRTAATENDTAWPSYHGQMRKARRESLTATVKTPMRANEEAWLSHGNKESPISLTMKSRTGERYVWGAAALILLLAPHCISARPVAKAAGVLSQEHRLLLYHTHTGERLDIVYRLGDEYVPEAIAK